jgi:hypothetical protein
MFASSPSNVQSRAVRCITTREVIYHDRSLGALNGCGLHREPGFAACKFDQPIDANGRAGDCLFLGPPSVGRRLAATLPPVCFHRLFQQRVLPIPKPVGQARNDFVDVGVKIRVAQGN